MIRWFLLLITLFVFSSEAHAQQSTAVPDYVYARIEQLAARFEHIGDYDTVFSASFLTAVPATQLTSIFSQFALQYGPVVRWYLTDSTAAEAYAGTFVMKKGFAVPFAITVNNDPPYRVEGFRILNATPLIPTLDSVVRLIGALPGKAGIEIAALTPGRPGASAPPVHRDAGIYVEIKPESGRRVLRAAHADSLFALGSSFKLWVLSALIKKVESGKAHWDDVVRLDSTSLSLPSGLLQTWPIGSPLTLATLATEMISISDNTATDLLIHWLSREAVEQAILESGSTHLASNNRPVLTTLEMFKLKSGGARLGEEYLKLGIHDREVYLNRVVDTVRRSSVRPFSAPTLIDKIEWFATPSEMSKALVWIKDHTDSASAGALARDILSVNPGVHVDRNAWTYVGYKGGSEPGVISMNYLLQARDGKWYTLTAAWNNQAETVDEERFVGLVERAIELLGEGE